MLAEERFGGLVHQVDVERVAVPEDVVQAHRMRAVGSVGDAVGVAAADGGEAGVEGLGSQGGTPDPHIAREHPGQAAQQPLLVLFPGVTGQVEMRDLAVGMDPRIGAPGDDEARPLGELDRIQPQDLREGIGQLAADGAPVRLDRPAGEVGAVIGEIEADADGGHPAIVAHRAARLDREVASAPPVVHYTAETPTAATAPKCDDRRRRRSVMQ